MNSTVGVARWARWGESGWHGDHNTAAWTSYMRAWPAVSSFGRRGSLVPWMSFFAWTNGGGHSGHGGVHQGSWSRPKLGFGFEQSTHAGTNRTQPQNSMLVATTRSKLYQTSFPGPTRLLERKRASRGSVAALRPTHCRGTTSCAWKQMGST